MFISVRKKVIEIDYLGQETEKEYTQLLQCDWFDLQEFKGLCTYDYRLEIPKMRGQKEVVIHLPSGIFFSQIFPDVYSAMHFSYLREIDSFDNNNNDNNEN